MYARPIPTPLQRRCGFCRAEPRLCTRVRYSPTADCILRAQYKHIPSQPPRPHEAFNPMEPPGIPVRGTATLTWSVPDNSSVEKVLVWEPYWGGQKVSSSFRARPLLRVSPCHLPLLLPLTRMRVFMPAGLVRPWVPSPPWQVLGVRYGRHLLAGVLLETAWEHCGGRWCVQYVGALLAPLRGDAGSQWRNTRQWGAHMLRQFMAFCRIRLHYGHAFLLYVARLPFVRCSYRLYGVMYRASS